VDIRSGAVVEEKLAKLLPARRAAATLELLSSPTSPLKQQGAVFQAVARLGAALGSTLQVRVEKELIHSHDWGLLVRMATSQLPTLAWLARFQPDGVDARCHRCGKQPETLVHIVWQCEWHAQRRHELVHGVRRMIFGEFGFWTGGEEQELLSLFLNESVVPLMFRVCGEAPRGMAGKLGRLNEGIESSRKILLEMWKRHVSGEE